MLWKKKKPIETQNNELFDKFLTIVKLMEVEITKLKAEVEQINGKLRKRIYRGDDDVSKEPNRGSRRSSEEVKDPFDNIREMQKDLNFNALGI